MSVLQNINGTLYRMDASDLVQLAAVDTEGILGGTPGDTTDGQTLVDQLAADDVQAQTDIGQIKTDLPNYLTIADEQVLGAWNLQPNRVNTQTIGEVTFTHNSDGTISYNSNGSAISSTREYVITVRYGKIGDLNFLKNGVYYLSGGISSQVKLVPFSTQNNAYTSYGEDTGRGLRFTVDGDSSSSDGAYVGLVLQVLTGAAVSGIVKPMIALKPNMPYVPYAMTNRELTDAIRYTIANFPTTTGSSYYLHKVGVLGILTIVAVLSGVTADTWTLIGTIASGARPIAAYFFACVAADTNNVVQGLLETDGSIKIKAHTGGNLNIRASVAYVIA